MTRKPTKSGRSAKRSTRVARPSLRQRDRYLKIVEWSEEDGCYVGTCPGLLQGGVHGADETNVYRELCDAVDECIELYERDGKPLPPATANRTYSGKFVLRVAPELHKTLAIRALKEGESLNTYVQRALRDAVDAPPS
jgi:predicted HicB family RNase H-like nuclease